MALGAAAGQGLGWPVLLDNTRETQAFDCGAAALNLYLQRHALASQSNGSARTYVTTPLASAGQVMGYFSLAAASAAHEAVPDRVRQGLARYPIPMLLLARLAVDKSAQGQGVGRSLLQSALQKYLAAVEVIGARALLVHAKDQAAANFYLGYGFEPSPLDAFHLFLLTKDIRKTLSL